MDATYRLKKLPLWLLWSLATILLWGTWGLVSKIASAGVDAYGNQLLYTVGLAPLMIFVAWTVHRHSRHEKRERRAAGVFWAFLTGILEITAAIQLRKQIANELWLILGGVLSLLFGVLMIWQPLAGAIAIVWVIGAYAIMFGILMIGLSLRLRKHATA